MLCLSAAAEVDTLNCSGKTFAASAISGIVSSALFHLQEKKAVLLPMFGESATAQPSSGGGSGQPRGGPRGGVVLVSGATGGVGKRVVAALLSQGRAVRALVRDVEKARSLLVSAPLSERLSCV